MARALDAPHARSAVGPGSSLKSDPDDQAWQLLYVAFVVAPIVAGVDKFFGLLVNWDQYLARSSPRCPPLGATT